SHLAAAGAAGLGLGVGGAKPGAAGLGLRAPAKPAACQAAAAKPGAREATRAKPHPAGGQAVSRSAGQAVGAATRPPQVRRTISRGRSTILIGSAGRSPVIPAPQQVGGPAPPPPRR